MAERDVVNRIIKELRDRGAYAVKIHGDFYQASTVDILACYKGRFIGIEAKFGRGTATPIQQHTLKEIKDAGGFSTVAYSWNEVAELLRTIDDEIRDG